MDGQTRQVRKPGEIGGHIAIGRGADYGSHDRISSVGVCDTQMEAPNPGQSHHQRHPDGGVMDTMRVN